MWNLLTMLPVTGVLVDATLEVKCLPLTSHLGPVFVCRALKEWCSDVCRVLRNGGCSYSFAKASELVCYLHLSKQVCYLMHSVLGVQILWYNMSSFAKWHSVVSKSSLSCAIYQLWDTCEIRYPCLSCWEEWLWGSPFSQAVWKESGRSGLEGAQVVRTISWEFGQWFLSSIVSLGFDSKKVRVY